MVFLRKVLWFCEELGICPVQTRVILYTRDLFLLLRVCLFNIMRCLVITKGEYLPHSSFCILGSARVWLLAWPFVQLRFWFGCVRVFYSILKLLQDISSLEPDRFVFGSNKIVILVPLGKEVYVFPVSPLYFDPDQVRPLDELC